jgi:hypothetical protein
MAASRRPDARPDPHHPLATAKRWLADFHWLHLTISLAGNASFFVGSILFLWEATKLAGTWLFIIGSLGMLLGSVGDRIVEADEDGDG